MIKLEKTDVFGWEAAIRGMRNPMNSWDKSDSWYCEEDCPHIINGTEPSKECNNGACGFCIGQNDLKLMKSLAKAGSDHSKFLRMINVTVDITAPLYWWKEFDTYKVGTVANSCSTMHKIHAKEFTLEDFSHEHLTDWCHDGELCRDWLGDLEDLIDDLNFAREKYLETKDKKYWWQIIQLLPTSYNQKRTVQLTYEVLRAMDRPGRRKDHKLDEWREFCKWAETLPYLKEICIDV